MLDVIGVGLGRTGTSSLKTALERLGFGPCHHMKELIEHPELIPVWQRLAAGERPDWEEVFRGYRSTTDWPAVSFWRDLIRAYPEAKVILTVRDPERWYASVRNSIYRSAEHPDDPDVVAATRAMPHLADQQALVRDLIWDGDFDGRFEDQAYATSVFEQHAAAVREEVPPERLLVLDVRDGWAPLCDFLGVAVPDEPFPHENDSAEFNRRIRERAGGAGD